MGKKTLSCHEHSARSSRSKPQLNGPGAYYNDKTSVSPAHSPRVGHRPQHGHCCSLTSVSAAHSPRVGVTAHNMDTVAHWSRAPVELIDAEAKNATPQMTSSTYKKDTSNISRERPHVRTKPKSIRPTEVPRPRIELGPSDLQSDALPTELSRLGYWGATCLGPRLCVTTTHHPPSRPRGSTVSFVDTHS